MRSFAKIPCPGIKVPENDPSYTEPAQYLRADSDHLMAFYELLDLLAEIIPAVILAVFAKQAGTYRYLHFRPRDNLATEIIPPGLSVPGT